ncbi:MAG: hypothetical protein KDB01_19470 [Planctomycetaceae bacterium]|nr:hypothetical protein [Planctomycetaceae bacterium]
MNRKAIFQVRTDLPATSQQAIDDLTVFLTEFGISADDYALYEFENEIQLRYDSPDVQKAVIGLIAWDQFVRKSATTPLKQIPEFAGSSKVDVNRLMNRRFTIDERSIPVEV